MIRIPGRLSVRTVHGRHGPFNVGRLATSIGEFVVKDPQLDQIGEGQADGEFLLQSIFPASYVTGGRIVVEMRAKIGEIIFADDGTLTVGGRPAEALAAVGDPERPPVAEAPPMMDSVPMGDQPVGEPQHPVEPPRPTGEEEPFGVSQTDDDPDAELFGVIWPLGEQVKLDATVDRQTLRQQASRLSELGYSFDAPTQTWYRT